MEKKVTSKNTSINKRRPAICRLLEKHVAPFILKENGIFDNGCGKYPEFFADWATEKGIRYMGVDPYNCKEGYTNELMRVYGYSAFPCWISSNVLNVLPKKQRYEYVKKMIDACPSWIFATVYEGDKTGFGSYGDDSYQANLKTGEMLKWLISNFPDVNWERKGKLIFANMHTPE